ncbi:MAG: T9SS type A sorting domain-containing protein [Elusimicrobiota bacterium]
MNKLIKSFLIINIILSSLVCRSQSATETLSGGVFKIFHGRFNQGGSKTLEGGGYSLVPRMGKMVGNLFLSSDIYYVQPTQITSISQSGRLAADNLRNAHVYPNPFKASKGHTFIKFTALTADVEIKIFTVSGEFVRSIYKNDPSTDELTWDIRNDVGEIVFSGIYLYFIKSAGDVKTGKIIVVR